MINALAFPEGARLLKQALPVATRIARLERRLNAAGVPAIYFTSKPRMRASKALASTHGIALAVM